MSQRIILSLGSGDMYSGFPAVTAHLWESDDLYPLKFVASLPAAPEIPELYRSWQLVYEALHHRLDWNSRIEIETADVTNVSEVEFSQLCQQLIQQINIWLNSESFRNIEQSLRTRLNATDEIRWLIETNDRLVQKLPWHLWNFFEHYPNAEVALSAVEYQRSHRLHSQSTRGKVRILAILGNSRGLNLDQDRTFLEQLSNQADIEFLVEPRRKQLNDRLWQQWDLLFFAGHSSSREQGLIQINPDEHLTLEQLRYALRRSISQGLKLAIFNSCDGLDLARQLADLHIPQVIVMREPVPDVVAHTFLKNFLRAFSSGRSLYAAVREARERLHGLEDEYLCASWLPVIYQNPAVAPTAWQDWRGNGAGASSNRRRSLRNVLLTSMAITGLMMGVRGLGWLQTWELQAFDHLMRSRPSEPQDQRILIVTITEEDFQLPVQQRRKGSLSDVALTRLLDRLEPYQPRAIGLDIYRDSPASQTLVERLRQSDHFFAICKGQDTRNHPGIASSSEVPPERQGFSDVVQDSDGVLRRHLLVMEQEPASPCTTPYALSAQLAFHYLAAEKIVAKYTSDQHLQLGNVIFSPLHTGMGGYQRLDARGYQILLNYRSHRSPLEIAPTVTLSDVLAGKVKPEQVKDRIVLIGVVAQSAHDYLPTPYSGRSESFQEMPGVIVQAQMLSQILSAVKDGRSPLEPWSLWGDVVWVWVWAVMGGAIALRGQSPLYLALAAGSTTGALSLLCWGLFIQGAWVPWIPAILGIVGTGSTIVISQSSRSHPFISLERQNQ